jgi:hypothetical protein
MVVGAVLCAVVLLSAEPSPPPVIKQGTRILFIGNSLTGFFGPLDNVLADLCKGSTPSFTITHANIGKGEGTLEEYVTMTELGIKKKIEEKWDIVILQGWNDAIGEINNIGHHEVFYANARILDGWIKATGAKTGFFMFHPPKTDWQRYPWIRHSNETIAKELGAFVIPCAVAWDSVRGYYPQAANPSYISILYHDFVHQNANGMALNGYVFYSALTGKSAAGIPLTVSGGNGLPYPSPMDARLRQIAFNTVRDYKPTYPLGPVSVSSAGRASAAPASGRGRAISLVPILLNGRSWFGGSSCYRAHEGDLSRGLNLVLPQGSEQARR